MYVLARLRPDAATGAPRHPYPLGSYRPLAAAARAIQTPVPSFAKSEYMPRLCCAASAPS